jgi:hypothetical protein
MQAQDVGGDVATFPPFATRNGDGDAGYVASVAAIWSFQFFSMFMHIMCALRH